MSLSIDVVIPVRNAWEYTERCLAHLRRQTVPHRVIVCDNGSTDGTVQRLRRSYPEARVLELGRNLGFSAACNRGAQAGDGEFLVLLNNDVDCRPDFLERLVAPLDEDDRLGSTAPLLLEPGGATIESFGLAADPTLAGFPRLRGQPPDRARTPALTLAGPSGAAGAYRRRAWKEVGGLDEGVFFYAEDLDLALRLRAAGWQTLGIPDAVAIHHGSASAGRRSAWQRYQSGFSRGYFLRRYGVLRSSVGLRAVAVEGLVAMVDAVVFSHDLAAVRGRVAGWKAAAGRPRHPRPPADAIDDRIGLWRSLQLRREVYGISLPRRASRG